MQQIFLVISAIVLGLFVGNRTGGFEFSSVVCLVAGIFLVAPSLFKFKISDVAIARDHLPSIFKNLWINFLLLPIGALIIGYASQDIGIAAALFLLALLPGGGMVMMWIKQSGANVKLGFVIFMLNLMLLLPVTLVFGEYYDLAKDWFPPVDLSNTGIDASGRTIQPFAPFMILIVIPFLLSRFILKFLPGLVVVTGKHQQLISKVTMFGIVFYLFSLSTSQLLFQVSIPDLLNSVLATLAFYAMAFGTAILLAGDSDTDKAVFWHIVTRYITLALILAVFSVDTYGATFILPVMMAYFIQIGSAGFLSKHQAVTREKLV